MSEQTDDHQVVLLIASKLHPSTSVIDFVKADGVYKNRFVETHLLVVTILLPGAH